MVFGKIPTSIAGALLSGAAWSLALAQMPAVPAVEGTVFTVHAPAVGGCPSLDWHVWVGPNSTLSGVVSTGQTMHIWRVTGKLGAHSTFHLDTKEVGGLGRTGTLDGQVQPNGALVARMGPISGGSGACGDKAVYIRWFRHGNPGDATSGMSSGG